MKKTYIGFGLLMFLASCGGHSSNNDSNDSLGEGDSIMIDESTKLSDSTAKSDSENNIGPNLKFSSAEDLKDYLKKSPKSNEYSQGIIPLIADKSLEYAEKLVNNTHDGFIIVDKGRMQVILYDKYGREKLNYGMACARNYGTKHKKADSRTPEGFFTAEGIYDSTDWLYTNDNGVTSKVKGQFGPRFIRLKCPNTSQIGIHGTGAPWSIGSRASHGCIRIKNENILELVKHVTVGMPIIVVPSKRDMEVNKAEGYDITWIPSAPGISEPQPGILKLDEPKKENSATKTNENVNSVQTQDSTVNKKTEEPEVKSTDETPVETPEKDVQNTTSTGSTPSTDPILSE